jgi:hypothetical protein
VNGDPVTNLDAGHITADCEDIPGGIGARGVWEFDRNRVAAHAPDIVIVQCRSLDLDQDFIRFRLRIRNFLHGQDVLEVIIGCVLFVDKCFHRVILSVFG